MRKRNYAGVGPVGDAGLAPSPHRMTEEARFDPGGWRSGDGVGGGGEGRAREGWRGAVRRVGLGRVARWLADAAGFERGGHGEVFGCARNGRAGSGPEARVGGRDAGLGTAGARGVARGDIRATRRVRSAGWFGSVRRAGGAGFDSGCWRMGGGWARRDRGGVFGYARDGLAVAGSGAALTCGAGRGARVMAVACYKLD